MRRMTLVACLVVTASACGSSGPPPDPTQLTQAVAQNITIDPITMLQAIEVPIMTGGNPAPAGDIPLIALRDSVLRIFVTPGNDWTPHSITARARVVTTSPFGTTAQVFSAAAIVTSTSQESDITSTIQIPIPGVSLEMGSSVTVVLNDTTGDPPDIAQSYARWPADGSLADLGVRDGGDRLRVMIVPVQYGGDGSHRLPDTSDAQIESYRERFYSLYPTAEVDITVHDPWAWNSLISPTGGGFSNILQAFGQLRSSDMPDPDVYYYAAFEPAPDFQSYCGGGCITGLSPIGAPYSVGIGFTGDATSQTAVHEVGHAHGRYHAPCCGAGSPDPAYPYAGGFDGVWGYDTFNKVMVDPMKNTDMMGYCSPSWISDYHYNLLFTRARIDNGYYNDWMSGGSARSRFTLAPVEETGDVHVSTSVTREPWVSLGQPREASWEGGKATTYFFPYNHVAGGILYVPDEVPSSARVAGLRSFEAATLITR